MWSSSQWLSQSAAYAESASTGSWCSAAHDRDLGRVGGGCWLVLQSPVIHHSGPWCELTRGRGVRPSAR